MYDYQWDPETGGYLLTTRTGRFVANEIRPVFAEELELLGFSQRLSFDHNETRPLMWAQKNVYIYHGEKIAQCNGTQYGKPIEIAYTFEGTMNIEPVDVELMVKKNAEIMQAVVGDAKRRTKELYDSGINKCDKAYIAFSGGKDSIALLNLCDEVLPKDVPVIFSDTDMELPDTYVTWEEIQKLYPDRTFMAAKAEVSALDSWRIFGPPSRTIRWCCSILKSTPALINLKRILGKPSIRVMAFVGVRGEESVSRSFYEDSNEGVKNASQSNKMPLLEWGAHELWLYTFGNELYINRAYRMGLPRVGCAMCPESADKYVWLVNTVYPGLIESYTDIICETGNKSFASLEEKNEFIAKQGWQARKSGVTLKDTLAAPVESNDGLITTFKSTFFDQDRFFTWIKPLGNVTHDTVTGEMRLKLPRRLDDGIPFKYHKLYGGGGELSIAFRSEDERLEVIPGIRTLLKKVTACVACRACEAECTHGAISFADGKVQIDEEKCVHCKKCFDNLDNGCWRYASMRIPENSKSETVSINKYKNFGLREKADSLWVSTLVERRDQFFPWNESHPLGNKMVEACVPWFRQAYLTGKDKKVTPLVDLFEKQGGSSEIGWEFIWMSLANNAFLIKWFITATDVNTLYSTEKLMSMLTVDFPNFGASTIKGGMAALKDFVSKSPVGDGNMVSYEMKGRSVDSITRLSKEIHPLTVLYGLYLMARLSDTGTFTVTGMMDADINSSYISPIVAFGMPSADFKRICEGLRSRYPDYIDTTFTHGNDEVRIFPDKYTIDDIIVLAIQEA